MVQITSDCLFCRCLFCFWWSNIDVKVWERHYRTFTAKITLSLTANRNFIRVSLRDRHCKRRRTNLTLVTTRSLQLNKHGFIGEASLMMQLQRIAVFIGSSLRPRLSQWDAATPRVKSASKWKMTTSIVIKSPHQEVRGHLRKWRVAIRTPASLKRLFSKFFSSPWRITFLAVQYAAAHHGSTKKGAGGSFQNKAQLNACICCCRKSSLVEGKWQNSVMSSSSLGTKRSFARIKPALITF